MAGVHIVRAEKVKNVLCLVAVYGYILYRFQFRRCAAGEAQGKGVRGAVKFFLRHQYYFTAKACIAG